MVHRAAVLALCLMFLPMLVFAQEGEVEQEATSMEEAGGETLKGIRATHENYIKAVQEKDIDAVMALFADAPNTVLTGTGPDEIWLGKENIRKAYLAFFTNSEKESSERTLVSVGVKGDIAWYTGYTVVTQKNENTTSTFQINVSVVLEQIDATWYISALHFSTLTGSE